MSAALPDQGARDAIRGELATTLVVEAAAGTGKTTELVARLIALLASGAAQLDRVLAVTFTEKAAGEMKLRLRAELEKARAAAPGPEVRARLEAALAALEVAAVGTIHGLCADLLRARPVQAGIDPLFEVAAEEEMLRLYDGAFERWFQGALADPPEGVRRLLRRRPEGRDAWTPREQLRKAGLDLVDHRDFPAAWERRPLARAEELARLVALLEDVVEPWPRALKPGDKLAQSLGKLHRFREELRRREELRGRDADGLEAELRALVGGGQWHWGDEGRGKLFAQGLERERVLQRRAELKAALEEFAARCDADLAALLREELRPLVALYEARKAAAGRLDFLDLLRAARDLVRDDAAVRAELQGRYTHLLVDEFQDTDPLQAELLLLLAADDPAERDWTHARARPGKLFVVGDPKQAIYRFRRADVALYEQVKAQLLAGGARLVHLTASFRAVPSLQAAVNAAFAPLMVASPGRGQAGYVALEAVREERAGQPTLVALPAPRLFGRASRVTKTAVRESFPEAVGAFVEWLVTRSGWTVTDRDAPAPVPLEARHVCLLFRNLKVWSGDVTRPYVVALEARGLPHVLVGGRSYHDREETLAVRNAAAAIEWPDDELHVFATLRGPLFALPDDALLAFRGAVGPLWPLRRLDLAALQGPVREVAEALAVLGELHRGRNRRPIADTLRRLLDATRAHAGIAIWRSGEQALANVLRALDLARRFEQAGATSFRAFVEFLAEAAERGEQGEAPVVEEGTEGVRLMTAHKAKGLEFPVVVLCEPDAALTRRQPGKLIDAARGLCALPLAGCTPWDLLARSAELVERERDEAVRLAYVAATRARDLLVVPTTGLGELPGWLDPLRAAVQPAGALRRRPEPAPGCPPFGKQTVLDEPDGLPSGEAQVAPGLHRAAEGGHPVVWWDPHALALREEPPEGVRRHELLADDRGGPASAGAVRAHEAWRAARREAQARGARPSERTTTATALSLVRAEAGPAQPVRVERVEGREPGRPSGPRFGTLVHALLALARPGPDRPPGELAALALAQGRSLGATGAEIAAAEEAARAALAHPLLLRAAAGTELRREVELFHRLEDGALLEGVADLVFREAGAGGARWTVVDYKTDARPEAEPRYAHQLRLYAEAVAAATGEPCDAVLLAV